MTSLLSITAPVQEPKVVTKVPTVGRIATSTIKTNLATTTEIKAITLKKKIVKTYEPIEYTGDCEEFRTLISNYQWPVETAMAICAAESGGVPSRKNLGDTHRDANGNVICYGSFGLFQVGCIHEPTFGISEEDLLDPEQNIEIAYKIYVDGGFYPWSTYYGE